MRTKCDTIFYFFMCLAPFYIAELPVCNAALVLQFGQGASVGLNSFSVSPGDTISVDVYLTQTDSETRLNDENTSVSGYEFNLSLFDVMTLSPSTDVSFLNSVVYGPSFITSNISTFNGSIATIAGESSKAPNPEVPGVIASDDGVADNSVLLATIEIQLTNASSGTFRLTATPASDPFGSKIFSPDTVLFGGLSVGSGTADFSVTAVPEPSSLIGVGFACFVGFGGRRWRRRRLAG